jgi:putative ABC transport system ATP-binding protein
MADGIQSRFEQPMLQPVFAAKALTKTYVSGEVKVHALNNVDLQIAEKEVVVLLGPSGGGKSMLLNIMGGLDRPTSGQLFFRDSDLTVLEDRELTIYRREHVGFVFQFYNLIPSLTAYENIVLVAEVTKNPMRPADVLALVGLEERKGARSQTPYSSVAVRITGIAFG